MQHHTIPRATSTPPLDGDWNGSSWSDTPSLEIAHFHDNSSDHHPVTRVKLLYDDAGVHVLFRVEDRYVRCIDTNRNGHMCADSCAEFFVEPVAGHGYFNFEITCGGTALVHFNAQSASIRYDPVELDNTRLDLLKIYHSMPRIVDPEITDPATWLLQYFIPYELFECYVGPVSRQAGTIWRGNFYKCADGTSHPHWAMWNRIPGKLGFHKPEFFAPLQLED